jgi:hypothetical protein
VVDGPTLRFPVLRDENVASVRRRLSRSTSHSVFRKLIFHEKNRETPLGDNDVLFDLLSNRPDSSAIIGRREEE